MQKKLGLSIIGVIALAVFVAYSPVIDQYLASIPYNYVTQKFYGEVHLWCKVIYYSIPVVTTLFIVVPLWYLVRSKTTKNPAATRRAAVIVLMSLVIGPGLVVNTLFKNNWGRPRPYQVIRDGKTFSPVWHANWGNSKDNSFPCGHATMGFFLGVPLLARGRRRTGLYLSLAGGSLVSLVRMLQGGHYFSDVIFCGIFVWLTAEIVNYGVKCVWKVPISE